MRVLILAFVLVVAACTTSVPPSAPSTTPVAAPISPPKAAPETAPRAAPRNFVCERFADINAKAICTPESTDEGEHHLHRARVAIDQQLISCVINDANASVMCADLIVIQQPPASAPAPTPKKKP